MLLGQIFDFVLHIDRYIQVILAEYGSLTYFILFLIIFLETGLVITPFLPGDSLIFIVGTFSAQGYLSALLLFFLLSAAAILGDSVNYWLGKYFGTKIEKIKFFKKEYLERTQEFYAKYGGKTIVIARFVPIVRTFAPFVAGIGKMDYVRFFSYNVVGGILWVGVFLFLGYWFGGISFVEENLTLVVMAIIVLSMIPPVWEFWKHKRKSN